MDDSETYMNMKPIKTGSRAPSRDHLTSTYTELNIRKVERLTNTQADGLDPTCCQLNLRHNGLLIAKDEDPPIASEPEEVPVTAQADCLKSIYSKLNFWRKDPLIGEDEGPPIATGPGGMPTTAETAAHEQESKVKIGNRPYRQIWILRLVTAALIVIVFGLSILVSQIRHSREICHRNYQAELRHQFTEMETKYRSVNETKAQICELLTSRREQACSKYWIRNEDRCYFISTFKRSYDEAMQYCSNSDSKLLEINSREKENFANSAVRDEDIPYWIAACISRKVTSDVAYKMNAGKSECSECKSGWISSCKNDQHRFICEKPASLCAAIPEKIRDLCQKPVEPT
ncbi:uncharacterized protein [Hemitrygon akajei]|uniref:uncharacterized protein n=1 Tax=Hemitrygon akajei TaxID=2704970 RepID=UPI003BFA1B43